MTDTKFHASQNLYEGAYLLCRGFKLSGKRQNGQKVVVLFEGDDIRTEAMKFYNGGKVEAKALTDAYRTLKDFVFER